MTAVRCHLSSAPVATVTGGVTSVLVEVTCGMGMGAGASVEVGASADEGAPL